MCCRVVCVDVGEGRALQGIEAIRTYFAKVVASGHKYTVGEQQAPRVCGDLALTSTRIPDGEVTAEVARRQADGTWLWVIDVFTIAERGAVLHRLAEGEVADLRPVRTPEFPGAVLPHM
jgi:hypothetical protein